MNSNACHPVLNTFVPYHTLLWTLTAPIVETYVQQIPVFVRVASPYSHAPEPLLCFVRPYYFFEYHQFSDLLLPFRVLLFSSAIPRSPSSLFTTHYTPLNLRFSVLMLIFCVLFRLSTVSLILLPSVVYSSHFVSV